MAVASAQKRRHTRKQAYLPVRLYPSNTVFCLETLSKDISQGGLRCVISDMPVPEARYRLEFILPKSHKTLSLTARQSWSRLIPNSGQYEVGLQFLDLSFEQFQQLQHDLELLPTAVG